MVRIKRLPRYAEIELQRLCAQAGALCHSVDEDESGWDRFIEFPEKNFSGPADMRPPREVAYVQVKSAQSRGLSCRVKLTNALRAAQSPQPWFIILVTSGIEDQPPRVFAVHVWGDLIRRTLEAARRTENERKPLHRHFLTIKFRSEDEKNGKLVNWMQEAIEAIGSEYSLKKRTINKKIGYEKGCGIGEFTLSADSEEEIIKNFIGLGDGLRIDNFTLTPSRFGLKAPVPEISISSGTIHITPEPRGKIEIRLRLKDNLHIISLQGDVYGTKIPYISENNEYIRFSAEFLEIILHPNGSINVTFNFDLTKKHRLDKFDKFSTIAQYISNDSIELQIWADRGRIMRGQISLEHSDKGSLYDWSKLFLIIRLLRSIAGNMNPDICLRDICRARGLQTLSDIANAKSFGLEFMPAAEMEEDRFTVISYWFHFNINEYTFFAISVRYVKDDIFLDDGRRRVIAGEERIIESYILKNSSDIEQQMMENDYLRHNEQLSQSGELLPLGELLEFLESQAKPPSEAAR